MVLAASQTYNDRDKNRKTTTKRLNQVKLNRAVGTGPADPAAAGPII